MPEIKIKRDQAELGGVPFITFRVWMYRPNEPDATICGYHFLPMQVQGAGRETIVTKAPLNIPVAEAFEKARCKAVEKCISAILIEDPDNLFELEQPR